MLMRVNYRTPKGLVSIELLKIDHAVCLSVRPSPTGSQTTIALGIKLRVSRMSVIRDRF